MTQQNENGLVANKESQKLTESSQKENKQSLRKRKDLYELYHNFHTQIFCALPYDFWPEKYHNQMTDAAILSMKEMDPKDPVEGMLMAQMVVTHNSLMECYRLSIHENLSIEQRTNYINNANKLVRSFIMLQDSLQRYQGKANHEQKIIVQHIQVSDGGQAIVGDVNKE